MKLPSFFFGRLTLYAVLAIAAGEITSFLGFLHPVVNTGAFFFLTILAFVLALVRLEYGMWMIFAEIVIGSKGYLFSESAFGFDISIRLAFFIAVFLAYTVHIIRTRRIAFFTLPYWKWWVALAVMIGLGALNGAQNDYALALVFRDANGYLFFGLLPVIIQAIRSREQLSRLFQIVTAGLLAMGGKTLIVLFLFSHNVPFLPVLYRWIRVTGVGEISKMDWNFYRVFFQSQLIALVFIFVLTVILLLQWNKRDLKTVFKERALRPFRPLFGLLFLVFLTTFISWSRSFWMAFFLTGGLLFLWLIVKERYRLKHIAVVLAGFVILVLASTAAVSGILNIPLDGSGWGDASLFRLAADRASEIEGEPAAASRFKLLVPLTETVLKAPLFGSGFGTTVTYATRDARALANNPNGLYTTFSFEWGYLDLLTEMGIAGLLIYLGLLWKIIRHGYHVQKNASADERSLALGIIFGLLALVAVHAVTPYLNHPIGIAFILLASTVFFIFSQPRHGDDTR